MEMMRKVPVAVIAALALQTAGALVWAGGAAARISVLEDKVGEHRQVAERLARGLRIFGRWPLAAHRPAGGRLDAGDAAEAVSPDR